MTRLEISGTLQRLRAEALRPISDRELDRLELEYRQLVRAMVRQFGYRPADVSRELDEFVRIATTPRRMHAAYI